jgi:hypothetical protein
MTTTQPPDDDISRKAKYDFLSTMYKSMWDNINRHVTVLWQSVAVLATAFAAALLVKRDSPAGQRDILFDVATALVVAASSWLVTHALDAANWFNRNIQIIGNIEKVFFKLMPREDWPHPYGHPSWHRENTVLLHMAIQSSLGVVVGLAALGFHFISRVLPDLHWNLRDVDLPRVLPYFTAVLGVLICLRVRRKTLAEQTKFQETLDKQRSGIDE